MWKYGYLMAAALTLSVAGWSAEAVAEPPAVASEENTELKHELHELRAQVARMQAQLDALQARSVAPQSARAITSPAPTAGLASGTAPAALPPGAPPPGVTPPGVAAAQTARPGGLIQDLTAAASYLRGRAAGSPEGVIVRGLEGVPKVFLPDIGGVGDFTLRQSDLRPGDPRYDPADDKFRVRDAQIIFFSPIDPYTSAQISIDKPASGPFDIEEAFLTFNQLPWGLTMRAGQFRPRFGLLNQTDTFQLPMVNRPNALARYITDDGFVEPGVNLSAYVPNPWDADLKADLNMVSGNNPMSFDHRGGRTFDFAYIGSLIYSRDITGASHMSGGLSMAGGPGTGGQSYLGDAFLTATYIPSQRHVLTWSAEGLMAEREGVGDHGLKRGIYSLLDYRYALRYHLGLLLDMADRPNVARGTEFGVSPILTYFVSDNTRLRLQYTHTTPSGSERAVDQVFLQATFSLGNLKPLE